MGRRFSIGLCVVSDTQRRRCVFLMDPESSLLLLFLIRLSSAE